MPALSLQHISKVYENLRAVDDISFEIEEGRMFGLLGPNGAGKTTTMRMIMNIIIPDQGKIELFGEPFTEGHKRQIGYLPEERGLYPKMKILDHLTFLGEMKGMSGRAARDNAREWLARFDLADRANRLVNELSKGLQQKIQFIGTILHRPRLLILDEPFSGLDPVNVKFLKDILLEMRREGCTIILSTHLMEQAEKLCEQICLFNRGKIVLEGDLGEIRRRHGHNRVLLSYNGNGDQLANLSMIAEKNDYGNYVEIHLHDNATPEDLFRALAQTDLTISRFEASETSLNDIFIELVEGLPHA
ncbi:MAG TPA: ATP-binding cassette domain-containing protein [Calditrichia bacterium]|nr:ATP-binding cassette domain-containing protein [Calditrichota bacterium]HQU73188.1 ATP-binding cassette domain-containing protein [Calditrichia bacterium]HQV30732.1 ATP-binding cassette domain-containing protein [Calditrichia bacterium]